MVFAVSSILQKVYRGQGQLCIIYMVQAIRIFEFSPPPLPPTPDRHFRPLGARFGPWDPHGSIRGVEISQNPDLELRGMKFRSISDRKPKTRNETFPADFRVRPGGGQNGPKSSDSLVFTTRDGPGGRPGTSPNPGAKSFE